MKWIFLVVGLVLGAIAAFATVVYAQMNRRDEVDDVLFPEKEYYEAGDVTVGISGTLTGKEMGYPNNTYAIVCFKERGECWYNNIRQIGKSHVGRLDFPGSIAIKKWNEYEVIASDDAYEGPYGWQCFKTTITISRKTKTALWVDEPINQLRPACAQADTQVRKYTIEDSPGEKRLRTH
jgi:hypothetical protein